jgi:hypothetical protein
MMTTDRRWQESYHAAVLEAAWTKMRERVQPAESEILTRQLELLQDHGGTEEGRQALVDAMNGLSNFAKRSGLVVGTTG